MKKVTFFKPYVLQSPEDALQIIYPYHLEVTTQEGNRQGDSQVTLSTSGSLLIDYGYNIWQTDDGYYNDFIKEMFPYVIDHVKAVTSFETGIIRFSTDKKPGNPESEWDQTKEIEGYEVIFE